ncbi:MAG: leucine-rich repeat domain-containing protein [Prevotella sp.]|nr:leucine-rich repeat domain-containing protein [Prevotella sp.]
MRKHLRFLMMAVAILFVNVAKAADDVTVGDLRYNFYSSGKACVKGFAGESKASITIPGSITYEVESESKTVEVAGIGNNAFKDNTVLEEVTIENTVTFNFNTGCFEGCTNLKKVVTTDLTYFLNGQRAFKNCTSLTQLGPTENVVRLGSNTNAEYEEVFMGCTSITKIGYKYYSTKIGKAWFKGCTNLTAPALINASVVGESAFEGCTALPYLNLLTTSNRALAFGKNAFKDCTSLAYVYLVQDARPVEELPDGVFEGCTSLAVISNYVHNSETNKYNPVSDLKLTRIGNNAFKGCTALTEVGNYKNRALLDGVAEIGVSAFEGCSALPRVDFTEGVTSIGSRAFANCEALATVTAPWTSPFAIENSVFSYATYTDATLNVPEGAEATYQATGGWQNFYDTTGIKLATEDDALNGNDTWYTIDGKRLQAEPSTKGIYVRGGKKIVVK